MSRSSRWPLVAAALFALPAALFVAANVLNSSFHVAWLFEALGPFADPGRGLADGVVTTVVLFGPVVAIALAVWPLVRLRWSRARGSIEATIAMSFAWPNVVVAGVALGLVAVLLGHVAAENVACWFGNARAC